MQTIDIAQAIKDNSANVSQNLDPSVLGELLPTATFNNKGILSSSAYRNIPQKINIGKERIHTIREATCISWFCLF